MPPRRSQKPPAKRIFQPLPKNSFWIASDAYDQRVWQHLRVESPSLRELCRAFGVWSPEGVLAHLKALHVAGVLRVELMTHRGIKVNGLKWVPVLVAS